MKMSIVISTQQAGFKAMAYQGEIAENLRKINDLGYDGVELAVRNPETLNLVELHALLAETGLIVSALGTGQAYGEEGLSFTHPDEIVRQAAINRVKSHIKMAAVFKAKVVIGLIRGKTEKDIDPARSDKWLVDALIECASVDPEVQLAVEPINRYETDLVNTVKTGLHLLDRVKMDNIGLLLDTFHMNIEEPSLCESIILAKERLYHVHIADSNRWYPGAGHIDFIQIFGLLERMAYSGFVSAEILPMPDPDTATIKTMAHLRNFLA